ncbi:hypothetical protein V5799_020933 [Amblyomma americanum]|uniref:Small acidic protein-like domain-containing protein n=1 Tax=Amblyomma americanum TaxID=6943 RepID=A0AAQ4ET00_AMBAM
MFTVSKSAERVRSVASVVLSVVCRGKSPSVSPEFCATTFSAPVVMTRNSPSKADRSPPSAYGRTDGDSSSRRGRKGGSSRRSSSRSRSRSRSPSHSRDHRGGSSSSRSSRSHRSHRRHGRSRSRERLRRDRSKSGSRSHRRSRSGSRGSGRESHKRSSPTERMDSGGAKAPSSSATSLASKTVAATAGAAAVSQAPATLGVAAPSVPTAVQPPGVSPALAAARAAAVRSGLMPAEALNAPPPQLPSSLPSYYNPTAVNPLKYSEQMQKRKLLWKKPQEEASTEAEPPSKTSSTCAKVWEGMTFAQDDDGKVTAKFRKLMGIRGDPPPPAEKPNPAANSLLQQQEKLFQDLDQQYEAARVSTHTHRGVGLGYSSQMATFFQPANLHTSGK